MALACLYSFYVFMLGCELGSNSQCFVFRKAEDQVRERRKSICVWQSADKTFAK